MSAPDQIDTTTGLVVATLLTLAWGWIATKPWRNRRG
jgi:hypothetical protein